MAKPDAVVTLSDEDREWIQNIIENLDIQVQVSFPPIPIGYLTALVNLHGCLMDILSEMQEVIAAYKEVHGVKR